MEPEYLKITIGPDEKTIVFPVVFDQSEDLWTVDCAYFDERANRRIQRTGYPNVPGQTPTQTRKAVGPVI